MSMPNNMSIAYKYSIYHNIDYFNERSEEMNQYIKKVLDIIKKRKFNKVLVLYSGFCSEGYSLCNLSFVNSIICVDISKEALNIAEEMKKKVIKCNNKINTFVCDITNKVDCITEFGQDVDLVLLMGSSLTHVPYNIFVKILQQLKNVLSNNGILIIQQFDVVEVILKQQDFIHLRYPFLETGLSALEKGKGVFVIPITYNKHQGSLESILLLIEDNKPPRLVRFTYNIYTISFIKALAEALGYRTLSVLDEDNIIILMHSTSEKSDKG